MLKAFKYRIYPTSEQSVLLTKSFGCTIASLFES
ncbi:helix-turn-helix domain-containing protein [Microcoleus sp. AT9_B5]